MPYLYTIKTPIPCLALKRILTNPIPYNDVVEDTWEFTDNEQKLLFDKGTEDEEDVGVPLLNDSQLNVEFTEVTVKNGQKKEGFKLKL